MHVWNPQLEHHLDIVDDNDENASTASAASDDATIVNDECSLPKEKDDDCSTDDVTEKRVFSQDEMEYIGVGLMCAFWYLGGGAVSLLHGVVMLVVFGTRIAWRRKQHDLHTIQKRKQEEFLKCRLKLSELLGSIGAPPLQQQSRRTERGIGPSIVLSNDYFDLVLDYCQAHVDLIHQVDHSLEMLKTATSMSLRSSTSSVERVELAKLSRSRTRSTVSLSTTRQMLSQVMMQQCKSLESLIAGKNEVNGGGEIPNVVTLAWLRLLRTELATLLSIQVSQLASPSSKAFPDAKRALNDSICAIKESTEYLASMFTLKQPPPQCQAEMDSSGMNLLYRQFEKAAVALWACQALGMTESTSESSKQADTRVMEFLQHFETLVCSIDDVKERLLNQCELEQKGSSDGLNTTEKEGDVNLNHFNDVRDYEDSGALSFEGSIPSTYPDDTFGNKTVVFVCSGRETIQEQEKNHNQSDENVGNQQHLSLQGMVLEELHHRLEKLEQAEEVDAKGNAIDMNMEVAAMPTVRQEQSRIRATSVCLGVSGDVLSELKRTLDVQNGSTEVMT